MLKYIVSGEKLSSSNPDISNLETVVSKIKQRSEVTTNYMKQWDRENHIKIEAELNTKKDDAIEIIRFGREDGVSDDTIRTRLETRLKLHPSVVNELFKQVVNDIV